MVSVSPDRPFPIEASIHGQRNAYRQSPDAGAKRAGVVCLDD
jgi:hypothetical protein